MYSYLSIVRRVVPMFKLGDYSEDEAKEITAILRKAGIKVDLKSSFSAAIDRTDYLEGKASELKGLVKDFEKYERWLEAIKEALASGATAEEFIHKFTLILDPDIEKKGARLEEMLESSSGELSEEEMNSQLEELDGLRASLLDSTYATDFAEDVLGMNDITPGESPASALDDPILRIMIDLEDYEESADLVKDMVRTELEASFEPLGTVYIDEFSLAVSQDLDEGFKEEYPEESFAMTALGNMIIGMMEEHKSGKMDMDEFEELCFWSHEEEGTVFSAFGYEIAENLAKALEKNDIIKIKGDVIKWKR
jgi:hypothetical protein